MNEHVMKIGGKEYRAEVKELTSGRAKVVVNSVEYDVELVSIGRKKVTGADMAPKPLPPPVAATIPMPSKAPAPHRHVPMAASQSGIVAPMPGAILQVRVKVGESVKAGQVLLVMEAMKMESPVPAPFDGTVIKIAVREGDNVGEGDLLFEVARPEMAMM